MIDINRAMDGGNMNFVMDVLWFNIILNAMVKRL